MKVLLICKVKPSYPRRIPCIFTGFTILNWINILLLKDFPLIWAVRNQLLEPLTSLYQNKRQENLRRNNKQIPIVSSSERLYSTWHIRSVNEEIVSNRKDLHNLGSSITMTMKNNAHKHYLHVKPKSCRTNLNSDGEGKTAHPVLY